MQKNSKTLGGALAIFCWASTFAVGRPLTEAVGVFTSTTLMYTLGGLVGLLYYSRSGNILASIRRQSLRYLLVCGGTFVVYTLFVYLAIGMVSTRQQVIEIALLNYLWPGLLVAFSLPLFKRKATVFLPIGLVLAFSGVALSMVQGGTFSPDLVLGNVKKDFLAYAVALSASVLWALHSNLSRLWGSEAGSELVCVFMIATGVCSLPFRFFFEEQSNFTLEAFLQLIYMALVPTFLAYVLWDSAMKKGNMILVASLSFFTPVIATVMSWVFLDLRASWLLWVACGLVLLGSYLANKSVRSLDGETVSD